MSEQPKTTLSIIEARKLSKNYGKSTIFADISFSIRPGTFTTLLGHNGAGKSTLLKLLSGTEFPDQGEVLFEGKSIFDWDMPNKKDIFYINENINIDVDMSMQQFIAKFREFFPRWHDEFFQSMIKHRKISLEKRYSDYSRGQKMQINLMMALAAKPKLLLLDEITSVMDVYARRYFLGLLSDYAKCGNTVVMTTNIISELQYYTDHLLLVQDKKLIIDAPLKEVESSFIKLRLPEKDEHPVFMDARAAWSGMNSDGSTNFVLPVEVLKQYDIPEHYFDKRAITLEDIFVHYYAQSNSKNEEDLRAYAA